MFCTILHFNVICLFLLWTSHVYIAQFHSLCLSSVILDFDFHMVFGCASKFQLICYMLYRSRCSYQAFFGSVGLLVLLQILCHI
ncbi:hypothetical protein RchiOBHm_Chr3g0450801 [Rosa chinensis]|uniref:Uncharacterized protein n=1 Tax=Rosa chinensis TaxID=74649 RepID=A0A2P6R5V7_ROSCH|nr:hypothetical protein RchiOBHm_Chr3g0450801 [Rosa chinensis]